MRRHQLLLIQAGAPTLDAIQILVDLVRAVEGDLHQGAGGQGVERDGCEAVVQDVLARLVARGHEAHVRRVEPQLRDGLDHVHDRRTAADADVARGGVEVVRHGAVGGVAFGGFDVHGGGVGVGGRKEGGGGGGGEGGIGEAGIGDGVLGAPKGKLLGGGKAAVRIMCASVSGLIILRGGVRGGGDGPEERRSEGKAGQLQHQSMAMGVVFWSIRSVSLNGWCCVREEVFHQFVLLEGPFLSPRQVPPAVLGASASASLRITPSLHGNCSVRSLARPMNFKLNIRVAKIHE